MGTVCSHSEKGATAKLEPIQYTARSDIFRATGSPTEEKFGITRPWGVSEARRRFEHE